MLGVIWDLIGIGGFRYSCSFGNNSGHDWTWNFSKVQFKGSYFTKVINMVAYPSIPPAVNFSYWRNWAPMHGVTSATNMKS